VTSRGCFVFLTSWTHFWSTDRGQTVPQRWVSLGLPALGRFKGEETFGVRSPLERGDFSFGGTATVGARLKTASSGSAPDSHVRFFFFNLLKKYSFINQN